MLIVKDNLCIGLPIVTFDFNSEIKTLEPQNNKELIDEALDYYTNKLKETFENFDRLIIEKITLAFLGIQSEFKEVPEDCKDIYETSKEEQKEILESKEFKIDNLKNSMKNICRALELVRKEAEELDILDSQEFLDYQDTLNKYSLDPDRK